MAAVNTTVQVTMPAMGESVTEGTILEWRVKEGDTIEADDIIVEISTDKVDAEVPSPAGGTIVKLHVAEGDTVEVGQLLAEISSNGDAPAAPAAEANGEAPAEAAPETEAPGEIIDIVPPAGGESVTEGTILEWAVKVGDSVADGDTIVEISTDKVDMELPAPAAGTITEIVAAEGETVTVGQVIARMQVGAGAAPAKSDEPSGNGAATAAPAPAANGDANATPVAQRVAAAEGVDLSTVTGTGPRGRITKDDVLNGGGNGAAAPAAGTESQPLKAARRCS